MFDKYFKFSEKRTHEIIHQICNCSLNKYYVKSIRYSEFFWSVVSRIRTEYGDLLCKFFQSECGKTQIRKTPNTDSLYTVAYCRYWEKFRLSFFQILDVQLNLLYVKFVNLL